MLRTLRLTALCTSAVFAMAAPYNEIRLMHAVIDTAPAVQTFMRSQNPHDKIAAESVSAQTLSRRGTLPYLVQFIGPVQEAWQHDVCNLPLTIDHYIPDNAFIVECAPNDLDKLAALPCVQWIGEYLPEYKFANAQRKTRSADVWTILTFAPDDAQIVAERVKALGGETLHIGAAQHGLVRAWIAPKALESIAALAEVEWIEPYVAPKLMNDLAVQGPLMNVETVWTNHGLTGKGQIIAHADTGLDNGVNDATLHPDFTNRLNIAFALGRTNTWSDVNGHGTHTAGSIVGNGSALTGRFKGVAYEAQLVHQSLEMANGDFYVPSPALSLFLQTYTNGARIHSDSWGGSVNGAYDALARDIDQFMWQYKDMLVVVAAGNEGADDNHNGVIDLDSMASPATAKNVLSVGAAEHQRTPARHLWNAPVAPILDDPVAFPFDSVHQGMAAFSSRGPCDDGRVKPDIVAPGTEIISCRSRAASGTAWGVYNSNYLYSGGSSMATPLTAGAAALTRQYLIERRSITNPSAALIKALLLNGARSLAPGQYGIAQFREIPPGARPNNVEGWGHINLGASCFPPAGCTSILHDTFALTTGASNVFNFSASGSNKLCVTLAWTDYPGAAGAGIKLVNDLDLLISTPNGMLLHPNGGAAADRLNNVEGLDFPAAASGTYTLVVRGYNVPNGPQPYALVIREDVGAAGPVLQYAPTNLVINTYSGDSNTATLVISNTGAATLGYAFSIPPPNYAAEKSTEDGGPVYNWIDIATLGTKVTLSDDGETALTAIGFAFPFFDTNYAQFAISANGVLAFVSGDVDNQNLSLPTDALPGPAVAVFWDDFLPRASSNIRYYKTPTNLVVSWIDVPRYRYGTESVGTQTFQVVLYASGEILLQYKNMSRNLTSATVGLQESAYGQYLQLAHNEPYLHSNLAVRITPPVSAWLSITPASGSVPPDGRAPVTFTANAAGLVSGVYAASVTLLHDDLLQPAQTLTVEARVVPEPAAWVGLFFIFLHRWRMTGRPRYTNQPR